jgi:hypothetical protein
MTILRGLLVHASLLVAAGCMREDESHPAADSSAAIATARLAVTARGIGALRAGMSTAEASRALGQSLSVTPGADSAACTYAAWRGGPAGVRVMVEGGRIVRVDIDSTGIATSDGARVGDSEARIDSLYRGQVMTTAMKYEPGHYLTVADRTDSAFAIVFEAVGGRVTRYRAGRRPQVEYVEGCG